MEKQYETKEHFSCVLPCTKKYSTKGCLRSHQKTCHVLLQATVQTNEDIRDLNAFIEELSGIHDLHLSCEQRKFTQELLNKHKWDRQWCYWGEMDLDIFLGDLDFNIFLNN